MFLKITPVLVVWMLGVGDVQCIELGLIHRNKFLELNGILLVCQATCTLAEGPVFDHGKYQVMYPNLSLFPVNVSQVNLRFATGKEHS